MAGPGPVGEVALPQAAVEMLNHLEDYLDQGDSLKILVAGKMGVGKSSLVNSIYGAVLAKEGTSAAAVTGEIINLTANIPTPYESGKSKDSTITVWDSPGFGDIFAKEREEKMIQELVWVVDKAHVLLYCFDIRQRLSNDDAIGLIEITKRVHPDIWRNAVFVLTFCNKLEPPPDENIDRVRFFKDTVDSWREQITRALSELAGVPDEIVRGISVVASGYRDKQPPGYKNWYTAFWSSIFEKTRDDGQPLLLKLTCNRMVDNGPDSIPDLSELEIATPDILGTSPYALKVDLFGDKDRPGFVSASPAPANSRNRAVSSPAHIQPVKPRQPSVNGHPANKAASLPRPIPVVPPPGSIIPEPPPAGIAVPVEPNHPSPPGDEVPEQGQEPEPEQPEPERPNEHEQPRDSRRKAFLKGAGGLAGATATGALVGALIGIVGGGIGMGVGAVGGAVVGVSIGVIGLIAMKLRQFIDKKKRAKAEAQAGPALV